jgi:hypothetical protein
VTKSPESGHNEVTDEARREAARTGQDICAILAAMLTKASTARDKARQKKIEHAQKFLGCRNARKRRKKA